MRNLVPHKGFKSHFPTDCTSTMHSYAMWRGQLIPPEILNKYKINYVFTTEFFSGCLCIGAVSSSAVVSVQRCNISCSALIKTVWGGRDRMNAISVVCIALSDLSPLTNVTNVNGINCEDDMWQNGCTRVQNISCQCEPAGVTTEMFGTTKLGRIHSLRIINFHYNPSFCC